LYALDTEIVEVLDIVSMLPHSKRRRANETIVKPLRDRGTKIQARIQAIIHEATIP
jgi:hypothetical protein